MQGRLVPFLLAVATSSLAYGQESAMSPRTAIVEQRVTARPMHYFVSLPEHWTPDRDWPVVVVITDAYREFQATARAFADARGSKPFIIVVPLVLSGGAPAQKHMTDFDYSASDWAVAERVGNCKFDEDGMTAALADVRARYRGDPRVFFTGWEAGGHVVLAQLFNHPDRVRGVVAATPNYLARCVQGNAKPSRVAASIPIRGFHGSDDTGWGAADQSWWVTQWRLVDSTARARGFTSVKDTVIQNEGRGSMPSAVLSFFAALIGG